MRKSYSKTWSKVILTFIILSISIRFSYSQKLESWIKAGDQAFGIEKDFRTAYNYYKTALIYDSTKIDIWVKLGESARNILGLYSARVAYDKVLSFPDSVITAENYYHSAWINMRLANYKAAHTQFQTYFRKAKENDPFKSQATILDESCVNILKNFPLIASFSPRTTKLPSNGDCLDAEFGATPFKESIVFSQFSEFEKVTSRKDTVAFNSTFKVSKEGSPDSIWSENLGMPNKVLSGLTFLPNNKGIYYCLCDKVNLLNLQCDIFFRKMEENGSFGNPVLLKANQQGYSTQHPSVGMDEKDNLWLYFSSDRPGGKGKFDLYRGNILEDGQLEEIENLSSLNTEQEDITPFFHNGTQSLYFSTQGRFTFGGFDVYTTIETKEGWTNPRNMGIQLNASSDDLFFTLSEKGEKGWLTVRGEKGASCTSEEPDACCYNIVTWKMPDRKVKIIARNSIDSSVISDASMTIQTLPSGNPEKFAISYGTWPDLSWNNTDNHAVNIKSDGFDTFQGNLSIDKYPYTEENLEIIVYLIPTEIELQVLIFDDRSKNALNGASVTLSKLKANQMSEDILKTNDLGNSFEFSIIQNLKYKLTASKENYESVEMPISFTLNDVKGLGNKITIEVYLKPPLSAPLSLYFDNDIPKDREMKIKGTENYLTLANKYFDQKETFISKFTDVLPQAERYVLKEQYDLFFDREVKMGSSSLEYLSTALALKLAEGKKIEITLNGFASPLGSVTANKMLSERRLKTIQNYLVTNNDGKLSAYIKSGQLKVITSAFGEAKATKKVSDNPRDKRNSVFSLVASAERRVEILVKILN